MAKYNLNRKYSLKQFENLDLYVEGLESREEIAKELEHFDQITEDYRQKLQADTEQGEPARKIRMAGTKEWLILKDNLLYKQDNPEKRPIEANAKVDEFLAGEKDPEILNYDTKEVIIPNKGEERK